MGKMSGVERNTKEVIQRLKRKKNHEELNTVTETCESQSAVE